MNLSIARAWRLPRREQITADQLNAIVRATPVSLLCVLVNASIIMVAFWPVAASWGLLAWFCMTLVIASFALRPGRERLDPAATPLSARAMRKTVRSAVVAALPWSVLVFGYLGDLPRGSELALISVCAGMTAGGSVLLAPVYPAALTFVSIVLVAVVVKCVMLLDAGYGPLALLTLSFNCFLWAVIATAARLSVERTQALQALTRTTQLLKERDALISEQNQRFEIAISNMAQGLCFFDGEERLIVCNQRYIEMYRLDPARVKPGVSFREIVAMGYESGACPLVPQKEYLAGRRAIAGGDGHFEALLQDGRIFAIRYRMLAEGGWVATVDDVTERKRLHEQLEENHRLLKERSTLLQGIIDNFPGGISFLDKDLRIAVANEEARTLLDPSGELFVQGPPRFEDAMRHVAERGEFGPGDVEEQVAAKLALVTARHPYHLEHVRPDGTVLDVRGSPIEDGGVVITLMDITKRHRAEAEVAYMATHDFLTGLPNRVLFRERLEKAMSAARAGEGKTALLLLDLNKFKGVNDTLGHPVGDALLQAVGGRLANCVRAGDTVARLGGDEFAIVLQAADAAAEAAMIAGRIRSVLTTPFELGAHKVEIGTSIGIALSTSEAMDPDKLIERADVALYRAKATGRDCFQFFEPRIEERMAG